MDDYTFIAVPPIKIHGRSMKEEESLNDIFSTTMFT